MMDLSAVPCTAEERARWFRSYLKALKEERHKILLFQKELPLSLHLVTQAIASYRQQIASDVVAGGSSLEEAEEEETSTEGAPILEEFIPLKRGSSSAAEDEEEASGRQLPNDQARQKKASAEKKHDWLRSVQLWTQQPNSGPLPTEEDVIGRGIDERRSLLNLDTNKSTSAFVPFHPPQRSPSAVASERTAALKLTAPATRSNSDLDRGESGGCGGRDDKDVQPQRKIRRCWSEELHRKFLEALRQLGGVDSATPKWIRELMKVDGLTNDEVKSHLQKYRLHSRRPSPTSHPSSAGAPPQQLAVGGGGICVPPKAYAAVRPPSERKPTNSPSGVYAPVASVPAPPKQRQNDRRGVNHSGSLAGDQDEHCIEVDGSEASAASSSTRTTTSSPGGRR